MVDLEIDVLGYVSPQNVKERYDDSLFGPDRSLTVFEEANMLLCGLTRAQIADMTPSELDAFADMVADRSTLLVGA